MVEWMKTFGSPISRASLVALVMERTQNTRLDLEKGQPPSPQDPESGFRFGTRHPIFVLSSEERDCLHVMRELSRSAQVRNLLHRIRISTIAFEPWVIAVDHRFFPR